MTDSTITAPMGDHSVTIFGVRWARHSALGLWELRGFVKGYRRLCLSPSLTQLLRLYVLMLRGRS